MPEGPALLEVHDLTTVFGSAHGVVEAVRGVSFELHPGETLALVGESGSGKTATILSVIGLLPASGRVLGGSVRLEGMELTGASDQVFQSVRGARIAIVFQDSMTSLNPVLKIGTQIKESLSLHLGLGGAAARRKAADLLREVNVPDPEGRLSQYPHQLSGGLRQRVAIAIALAPNPQILIADEPTTALDATVQAQVLDLLISEQQRRDMALLLVTHDLGVVANIADRVCVMYAGRIVESGSTLQIYRQPNHPYTRGLLQAVPRLGADAHIRLQSILGSPPPMWDIPAGCAFRPRCDFAVDRCKSEQPSLTPRANPGHSAECWVDLPELSA